MATSQRDPFAPLGTRGNRTARFGSNAPVPATYKPLVERALFLAYQLALDRLFNETFETALKQLNVASAAKDAYLVALEGMVIHLADSSTHARAIKANQDDAIAAKQDKRFQAPGAFSIVGGRDVWLRESLLKRNSERLVAGALMHEAAHLAGAPGDLLAEMGLEQLGNVSGYVRR